MGVHENKIEMLFVRNKDRGKGIGKKLIEYAIDKEDVKYVDVNEDNIEGVGFYKFQREKALFFERTVDILYRHLQLCIVQEGGNDQ